MIHALFASATATSVGVKDAGLVSATQDEPFQRMIFACGPKMLTAAPTAHPAFLAPKSTRSRVPLYFSAALGTSVQAAACAGAATATVPAAQPSAVAATSTAVLLMCPLPRSLHGVGQRVRQRLLVGKCNRPSGRKRTHQTLALHKARRPEPSDSGRLSRFGLAWRATRPSSSACASRRRPPGPPGRPW